MDSLIADLVQLSGASIFPRIFMELFNPNLGGGGGGGKPQVVFPW